MKILELLIDKKIIITNGFVKKTQRTPKAEIDLAKMRREDYIKREEDKNEKLRRVQERTSKKWFRICKVV